MRTTITIALLLAASLGKANAQANTCIRYINFLDPCADGLVAFGVCNDESLWSPTQILNYNRWVYADSPRRACEKYVMKADPGQEDKVDIVPQQVPGAWTCYWDYDNDGDIDYSATGAPIHEVTPVKDECCRRVPNGPYSNLAFNPNLAPPPVGPGADFSAAQRREIVKQNKGAGTLITSDVHSSLWGPGGPAEPHQVLVEITKTYRGTDDDDDPPVPVPLTNVQKAGVQVDHIIPQIDSKGCPCGTADWANALAISAELNQRMSNNCLHPDRLKILDKYTTLPAAREQGPSDTTSAPAAPPIIDEQQVGGCAAAGSGASALFALGFIGLVRRRRR